MIGVEDIRNLINEVAFKFPYPGSQLGLLFPIYFWHNNFNNSYIHNHTPTSSFMFFSTLFFFLSLPLSSFLITSLIKYFTSSLLFFLFLSISLFLSYHIFHIFSLIVLISFYLSSIYQSNQYWSEHSTFS